MTMQIKELIDTSKQDIKADKVKRRRDRELSDLRFILKTPEGRRFIWGLLSTAGIFHSSFSLNDAQTNFNEGRRSIGLKYLSDLMETKPDAYLYMQQEHSSEEKSEEMLEKEENKSSDLV